MKCRYLFNGRDCGIEGAGRLRSFIQDIQINALRDFATGICNRNKESGFIDLCVFSSFLLTSMHPLCMTYQAPVSIDNDYLLWKKKNV